MTPPITAATLIGAYYFTLKLKRVSNTARHTMPPASPTALLTATPKHTRTLPIISNQWIGRMSL